MASRSSHCVSDNYQPICEMTEADHSLFAVILKDVFDLKSYTFEYGGRILKVKARPSIVLVRFPGS